MQIEIGLGGVLNIPGDSGYGREKIIKCREDLNTIRPGCCFDYLEGIPASEDLAHWAEDEGFPYRVFTGLYDPSRMWAVHEYLMHESRGQLGLSIWADFSHYVHQLENAVCMKNHPAFAPGRRPGRTDFEAVVDKVIQSDLIVGGHLRCATPSPLGRERGAIQYPIVAPSSDPYADVTDELLHHGMWQEEKTRVWKNFYRALFTHSKKTESDQTLRFASEFIRCEDDYNMDGYTNYWQNINVIAWAKSVLKSIEKNWKQGK